MQLVRLFGEGEIVRVDVQDRSHVRTRFRIVGKEGGQLQMNAGGAKRRGKCVE